LLLKRKDTLFIVNFLSEPRFSQDFQDLQDFILYHNLGNRINLIKIIVQT